MEIESIRKLSMAERLGIHLSCNFFPPIHPAFVASAEEAIDEARNGNWDKQITLPNKRVTTVDNIVSDLHLEEFIEQ